MDARVLRREREVAVSSFQFRAANRPVAASDREPSMHEIFEAPAPKSGLIVYDVQACLST